jgi:hypothetical protein
VVSTTKALAFTDDGVDSLVELIKIHREMPPRPVA